MDDSSVADDHASGLACSWCGIYFVKAHGFPVLCHSCWRDADPQTRRDLAVQRATEKELD